MWLLNYRLSRAARLVSDGAADHGSGQCPLTMHRRLRIVWPFLVIGSAQLAAHDSPKYLEAVQTARPPILDGDMVSLMVNGNGAEMRFFEWRRPIRCLTIALFSVTS